MEFRSVFRRRSAKALWFIGCVHVAGMCNGVEGGCDPFAPILHIGLTSSESGEHPKRLWLHPPSLSVDKISCGLRLPDYKENILAEVTIKESTWKGLVKVARQRGKNPGTLADEALRDFLEREVDEELLERSSQAAQKTGFAIRDTEEIIRKQRKRKKT